MKKRENMNDEDDEDQLFDEKLQKYEEKLVTFFSDIGQQKRVNPKFLKMSSYLFVHKKLTQKTLKERTGFSTGTISTFLSVMLGAEFIEKELIPGTHTHIYRYKGNLEDLTSRGLDTALKYFLDAEGILQKKSEELSILIKQNKKGASHLSQRIDEIIRTYEFYRELFPKMGGNQNEEGN